jgi:hypothetical protein
VKVLQKRVGAIIDLKFRDRALAQEEETMRRLPHSPAFFVLPPPFYLPVKKNILFIFSFLYSPFFYFFFFVIFSLYLCYIYFINFFLTTNYVDYY